MRKENKVFLTLFMAVCIMISSVMTDIVQAQAVSNTSLITSYLKYFKQKKYKKARKYIKKMKDIDRDTSLKKMSKKQKKAYYKVVKKYEKKYPLDMSKSTVLYGYFLADLNKDKKPELLIEYGSCEADTRTDFYTFKKNKAVKVGEESSGHSWYAPYPGKGVLNLYAHMGGCSASVVTLKNGKIHTKYYETQRTEGEYCIPDLSLDNHTKSRADNSSYIDYSDLK